MRFFGDGYHQEHHSRPQAHWRLPLATRWKDKLVAAGRIVFLPGILGFLPVNRPLLHRSEALTDAQVGPSA
jgi:fatty acid desaturase